ncbi:hypothetical protein HI914_06015 [Erysiphe necator]|uniref:Uncharacterized protein n=1 Tax=Uncinula necator TaxID=52586 RepID=A0A0B1P622_UNCNE|nr:hypothetical protein HI914_06015 [Erysiphe necator]KHJ32765.1 hypothetical protein EV44_g4597 [Erysiphe necator]
MGKSQIFSFPLSGRKNVAKQTSNLAVPAQPISKAQRILGVEAIDLNICTSKPISSSDHSNGNQLPISPLSNIDIFGTRDELYQESMPNISGKASSILGISQSDFENRKSLSLSVRSYNSIGAYSCGKSWTPRSDDCSRKSSLSSQGMSHSWVSNRELGAEHSLSHRYCNMAHIGTYIDETLDHIPELPGDSPSLWMPKLSSASHSFNDNRPGSSASCPIITSLKTATVPEKLSTAYSKDSESLHSAANSIQRPQLRSNNKSLPYPSTDKANICSLKRRIDQKEMIDDQTPINISSPIMGYEEESESIQMNSRSSQHSFSLSQNDSGPTTPLAEIPFLAVPNFMDLKLSGPWNENQETLKSLGTSFDSKCSPSKPQIQDQPAIHTIPSTSSFTRQYFDYLGEYASNPLQQFEMSISSPPCSYPAENKDFQEPHLKVEDQSKSIKNDQTIEGIQVKSCENDVNMTLNISPHTSFSSNNSISAHSSDAQTQCIPLYINTNTSGWDYSSISSLCTDYDSATSATLLKNEPAYHHVPQEVIQDNRLSSVYPSTALMEVAQVAKVIRRAPVKEMKLRRKEKSSLASIKNSHKISVLPADKLVTDYANEKND